MTKILGYQIECHNEWCSGPKIWAFKRVKPEGPLPCPTCGWLAMSGGAGGIRELIDDDRLERWFEESPDEPETEPDDTFEDRMRIAEEFLGGLSEDQEGGDS